MKKFGLRFRINFVITLVIVLFAFASFDVLIEETRTLIREEVEAGTKVTVQLMETVIVNTRTNAQSGPHNQALLSFLRHLGRVRANEIKMYDDNDQLIYTSPALHYKQGKWAPDWFNRLVDPKIGEFRLNLPNGTVVITSDASRSILDAWDDLKSFIWLVLGFFVLVNVLVFWLLGRSLQPIGKILGAGPGNGKGRLDAADLGSFTELDSIGHTFNRMAESSSRAMPKTCGSRWWPSNLATPSSSTIWAQISFWNPAAEPPVRLSYGGNRGRARARCSPRRSGGGSERQPGRGHPRGWWKTWRRNAVAQDGRVVDVALSAAPLMDRRRRGNRRDLQPCATSPSTTGAADRA